MAFKLATKKTAAPKADESEFDGLWINVGVVTEDADGNDKFNRLPRGIAVADLVEHKIYANSATRNPEWHAEAQVVNALIGKIREVAANLEEGESISTNFAVQLYRRQEQVAPVEAAEVDMDLDALFG